MRSGRTSPLRLIHCPHVAQKIVFEVVEIFAKKLLELLEPLARLNSDKWSLLGKGFEVFDVGLGTPWRAEQEIVEGPGFGIGVGRRLGVAEAFIFAKELLQAAGRPASQVL